MVLLGYTAKKSNSNTAVISSLCPLRLEMISQLKFNGSKESLNNPIILRKSYITHTLSFSVYIQ